jgi:adenosylhomocysteinase
MDMSFANQAMAARFLVQEQDKLENIVYRVPEEIDQEIAQLKLTAMGVEIDTLTDAQKHYLQSWQTGT